MPPRERAGILAKEGERERGGGRGERREAACLRGGKREIAKWRLINAIRRACAPARNVKEWHEGETGAAVMTRAELKGSSPLQFSSRN